MKHSSKLVVLALAALLLVGTAAVAKNEPLDERGAREGSITGGPAPGPHAPGDFLINEDFADITTLPGAGWFTQNNSDVPNLDWFQGNPAVFPAQAGAPEAYIAANFNSTGGSVISNWLLTPELDWSIVDTVSFWTRTVTGNTFPDRMEVRRSDTGASTDVGTLPTDVGDFTDLLVEINPALAAGGYPQDWTEFVIANPGWTGTGRIAFRYWVTDAGPFGANSNFIGVDTVQVVEGEPVPTTTTVGLATMMVLLAVLGVIAIRRRVF